MSVNLQGEGAVIWRPALRNPGTVPVTFFQGWAAVDDVFVFSL